MDTFTSLSEQLRKVVELLGLTATDPQLVAVFEGLAISPPEDLEGSQTTTTDENQLEFRFEDGVLVQVWVNPGSEYALPKGLQWDISPEDLKSRLGPGEPLGIDKEAPNALRWVLARDEARGGRLFLHMNVEGGFTLNAEAAGLS
jgi:hypothetical protein